MAFIPSGFERPIPPIVARISVAAAAALGFHGDLGVSAIDKRRQI